MLGKEKYVITGKLITDTHGAKMGKSLGNVINLTDNPEDIFGKIMAFSDGMILSAFEILTEVPMEEIAKMQKEIEAGSTNPMVFKKQLAFEVTKWIKGEEGAKAAQNHFEKTVQGQETPEEIVELKTEKTNIIDILENAPGIESRGEIKRLIKGGAVQVDGNKIDDTSYEITSRPALIQYGKRKWVKIVK
jgi:tyrosyl-tRNA synthetase